MIKLNLLPQYVIEFRRIRVVIIAFVVVLAIQAGVVFKAFTDLKSQQAWFDTDKKYFDDMKAKYDKAAADAAAIKDVSGKYRPFIDFFGREPAVKHNEEIIKAFKEVAKMVGGGPQWYNDLTLDGKKVTMHGKIDKLMNFVNFYFRMKDSGFTVEPAAKPAQKLGENTMGQRIDLVVSGDITTELPGAIAPPGDVSTPSSLYVPVGGGGGDTSGAPQTSGTMTIPSGPGPGQMPSGPGPMPMPMPNGPGPMPNGPGPMTNGPGPMPSGPGPMPSGPGPMPSGPGPMPSGPPPR